ncbi:Cro/CI family transcriptional regulator [Aeromonas veronii]|uniref:Cro/CI family transcriptional regulator n=1 Tax=Aeromonas TaxID=642 RepID=UPI002B46FC52|nr:Cro/CI family transcriptional regulator [Aeromonas veronii]
MKKHDAVQHYGSVVQLAAALGIKPQSVSQWGETIPQGRAYQLELMTGGQLKADTTALPGQERDTQRVATTAIPADFPCVKRAIAAANALSGNAS